MAAVTTAKEAGFAEADEGVEVFWHSMTKVKSYLGAGHEALW